MIREEGICPFTGRIDMSLDDEEAVADALEAAHIISQPISEEVKGGLEARKKVVSPLQATLHNEPH